MVLVTLGTGVADDLASLLTALSELGLAWDLYANEDSTPEVHGINYFGYYHDKEHAVHIWFGAPIP